jgi:hypothetical protein
LAPALLPIGDLTDGEGVGDPLICRSGAPAPTSTTFFLVASMVVSLHGSCYLSRAAGQLCSRSLPYNRSTALLLLFFGC